MEPPSTSPATAGLLSRLATEPTVVVLDPRWRRVVRRAEALVARAALAAGGAATVVLSTDREVKTLNTRHRNRRKPTNVLTFEPMANPMGGFLGGDIVLALGTVRREAAALGRSPAHHMAHLVVHGALHLRGHDHHGVGEARRMEMAETRILHRLGVPNPWKRR
jgi:probable rRNA maturation factor